MSGWRHKIEPPEARRRISLAIIAYMTTVEILFRYALPPTESQVFALANTRDVYGIRRLSFDHAAHALRVEYDATRLDPAQVAQLVRRAGLQIAEEPLIAPPAAPVPVSAA